MTCLREYHWPGNARELVNAVNHAVLICRGDCIRVADLPSELRNEGGGWDPGPESGDERERIMAALARANGNRTLAAMALGISRATLYRRFETYDIDPD